MRLASAADYPTTILADHPVAYYRLEEPNGSATVADSSGNGNTGYVTYVTQGDNITVYPQLGLPGIDTNSALFATSTGPGQGNIDVPWTSAMNPTVPDGTNGAPFSAELWVQATKQSSGYGVPLDDSCNFAQPPPWNNSAGWNFYQTAGPGSTWSFSLRPNPGFVGNGPAVTVGQWTHLVLTLRWHKRNFLRQWRCLRHVCHPPCILPIPGRVQRPICSWAKARIPGRFPLMGMWMRLPFTTTR